MKNRQILFILGLALLIIFAGCSNDPNEQEVEETIKPIENIQEEIEEESHLNDSNDNEQESDEEIEAGEEIVKATYEVNQANWAITPIDDANEQIVLLTIDDAPDKYALEMAKTLKALDAPAIFFVNGHFIDTPEEKETLKEIYNMGFMIGNHTYSHPNLKQISEEEQREEIIRVNDMVEEIIGERPSVFRAPFGENTDYTKQVVAEEGMVLMNWSYGYDWVQEYMTKEAITEIMINAPQLSAGANLLMHDREHTAAALHDIVIGLRDKGYEIVDPKLIKKE